MKTNNYYFDPDVGKRGKHIYREQLTYKGIRLSVYGSSCVSKAEAKRKYLADREAKISAVEHGIDIKAGRLKLRDGMQAWYDRYVRSKTQRGRQRSPLTVATDETHMRLIWQQIGDINVCDLDSDTLQDYFNQIAADGYAERVRRGWLLLSQYLRYARPQNNPMLSCVRPQVQPKEPQDDDDVETLAYSDTAMVRLTKQLRDNPFGNVASQAVERGRMLITMMWQYMRVGEAQELRVKDVDFNNNELHIDRQYNEQHKIVIPPKDNSRRIMHISGNCRDVLMQACADKEPEDLVFVGNKRNAHGGRVLRGALRDTLNAACEAIGADRHTLHDLRHDGISYYVRHNAKPKTIMRWAGHRSLQVTLDIYYRDDGMDDDADVSTMERCTIPA